MKRLLEIESKFRFERSLLPRFRLNQGSPSFISLTFLRVHCFEDTYLDHDDVLSKNGIYIRERVDNASKAVLEVKRRVSGGYTHSAFEELTDEDAIRDLVQKYLPERSLEGRHLGLDLVARFTTTRESYIADEKFSLDLDDTDFGHSVGEVELITEDAEQARRDLDVFLEKYSWFCLGGPVTGKLSAYFEHARQAAFGKNNVSSTSAGLKGPKVGSNYLESNVTT